MAPELDPTLTELLACLAGPETSAELAARFGVTVSVIRRRIRLVYDHLGVSERSDAVAVAVARGLIPPPDPVVPAHPRRRGPPAR